MLLIIDLILIYVLSKSFELSVLSIIFVILYVFLLFESGFSFFMKIRILLLSWIIKFFVFFGNMFVKILLIFMFLIFFVFGM